MKLWAINLVNRPMFHVNIGDVPRDLWVAQFALSRLLNMLAEKSLEVQNRSILCRQLPIEGTVLFSVSTLRFVSGGSCMKWNRFSEPALSVSL